MIRKYNKISHTCQYKNRTPVSPDRCATVIASAFRLPGIVSHRLQAGDAEICGHHTFDEDLPAKVAGIVHQIESAFDCGFGQLDVEALE